MKISYVRTALSFIDGNTRVVMMRLMSYMRFRRMRTSNSILLYLLFWAFYGPLAVGLWYYDGSGLVNLGIGLLIGLGIILGYLFYKDLHRVRTRISVVEEEPEPFDVPNFDNVFKLNFGRVEIDLD